MSFRYSKNELDNKLFQEVSKKDISKEKIEHLLKNGANINAIDCKEDTVLANLIDTINDENIDINYLKLLIELGADVNLRIAGVNSLFHGIHIYRKDIFEILLEAGADPNCIIDDEGETILDLLICDRYFCELENDLKEVLIQKEKEELLIEYGAKRSKELFSVKPNKYIWINNVFLTGIITYDGNIEPENIPNIGKELINEFKIWLNRKPVDWNLPMETYQNYYDNGIEIAQKIKKLLGNEIEVKINYLTCELWEKNQRGRYRWKVIEI